VSGSRAAAFLDRDGTIIHDAEYLGDPAGVQLLAGAAAAIARLNANRIAVIVVTNQSGIARGLLTEADYERVRARLDEILAADGARIDATYVCPHHPDFTGPCACRKPSTLLHRRAADERGLALERSWYLGDRWRDVAPALQLGGRGILIRSPATPADELRRAHATAAVEVAESLSQGVDRILSEALARRSPGVPHP
jgi:D-glycero-D-manno-heptose 1,7-bisphosphate phosphatase